MGATIKEVAKRAGVSIATVSRVFNDSNLVQEETRERVRRAATELRFTPNASARSLSTNKTLTIGVILPDLYGEFFSEVIRGADQTARKNSYYLLVASSHNDKREIEATLKVLRGRVDGLIIMSPNIDAQSLHLNLPSSLPILLLHCSGCGTEFDAINVDNVTGAYEIVKHLIGHGHTRIAIVKGTENNFDADQRLEGYWRALSEAGIPRDASFEVAGDFSEAAGYDAVEQLLALPRKPTAVFAANDSMAIGAMSALRDREVSIPHGMAVAGFDDIPIAHYLTPALTTVRVSISNLGELAVERLIHAIQKKNAHAKEQILLPTSLVVRESCGCGLGEKPVDE